MKLYVRSSFLASAPDGHEWLASRPAQFTPGEERPYHISYTGFWWGNVRKRDHLEDPGINGRIILRRIFRKWDVEVWAGSNWLRIGTGGGHL